MNGAILCCCNPVISNPCQASALALTFSGMLNGGTISRTCPMNWGQPNCAPGGIQHNVSQIIQTIFDGNGTIIVPRVGSSCTYQLEFNCYTPFLSPSTMPTDGLVCVEPNVITGPVTCAHVSVTGTFAGTSVGYTVTMTGIFLNEHDRVWNYSTGATLFQRVGSYGESDIFSCSFNFSGAELAAFLAGGDSPPGNNTIAGQSFAFTPLCSHPTAGSYGAVAGRPGGGGQVRIALIP